MVIRAREQRAQPLVLLLASQAHLPDLFEGLLRPAVTGQDLLVQLRHFHHTITRFCLLPLNAHEAALSGMSGTQGT